MTPEEFEFLSALVKKHSGLALTADKIYLLETRLQPVARGRGYPDLPALVAALRACPQDAVVKEVVEAMTTNESSFFRDSKPFDQLRQLVLPRLRGALEAQKRLRIWSAACATGQEPYTIAMCLQEEAARMAGWRYEILATDLAQKVLNKAQKGLYTQFEVQRGLPIQMLLKYFLQQPDNHWQVNDVLRQMIQFRIQNLLEDFTVLGKFDIIFCRNVLIYFDEVLKTQILERLSRCLSPHGILYLGSTETIIGLTDKFKQVDEERGIFTLA